MMKHKTLSILLAMFVSMVACVASAHDFEVDGIYYNITSSTESTVSVTYRGDYSYSYSNEYTGRVAIPQTVTYSGKTYSVTSIGEGAFEGCSGLTSVTIPNSVTSIGIYAFKGTAWYDEQPDGLIYAGNIAYEYKGTMPQGTEIILKEGTVGIAAAAFSGCSGLTSVTIPNSVTSIDWSAFSGCSGLTSVTIPNSVTSIGGSAFSGCSGLTSVTIPNSVTSIGGSAFSGCSGLTSVTIPNSVTSIGIYAFKGTAWYDEQPDGLIYAGNIAYEYKGTMPQGAEIILKEGTVGIADVAFSGCSGLTSVTIPNSVTSIGWCAFSGCSGLTSVTIPNSVTWIDSNAFSGCSGLTSITIPSSVTSIGGAAFADCSGLTSVTIPNSVTSIGSSAFSGCSGLTSVTIPNSVTSIDWSAFSGCSGLTSVTIPNSVTSIGAYVFSGCSGLTSITIPNSVTEIDWSAFSGCSGLISVTLNSNTIAAKDLSGIFGSQVKEYVFGDGVSSIGSYACYNCENMTSVTIPNSVTSIGSSAFSGCSGLTSVTINSNTIASKSYQNSSNLSSIFGSQVKEYVFGDGVSSIGSSACYNCTNLASVIIPNSVISIGDYAFYGCSGLTSVTINSNTIASKSNEGSSILAGIFGSQVMEYVFGDGVESIGSYACYNCTNLASVTIPSSVTSIGNSAFSGCTDLTSVAIYSNTIASNTFDTSRTLVALFGTQVKEYVFGDGVESIGSYACYNCTNLTFVTIPNSVTSIGSYAFYGCSSLSSVTIPENLTSIGSSVFDGCDACSIYVKKGTAILLRLWNAGYMTYDITTHEQLVAPGVSLLESTASTLKCGLNNPYEEYAYQLSFDGQPVENTSFYETGLEPDHEYTVSLTVAENKDEPFVWNVPEVKVKTAALELTPQQPKVVTEGNVVVEAALNIQNDAEKVGVEWRRVDWTDDFPSNSATAYLFNGTIQGYIRNLNTNYLWKFRAFYESASGNRYYSGWMGIDPTNTSYFEPTVHTYAEHSIEGNSVQVRGYAQRGSENVTAQGFMYWAASAEVKAHRDGALAKAQTVPADAVQVEAKGTVMQTSLEGLSYNTTYNYVAFMTTSDGETYYGEQQTFTIGEAPTPVESVDVAPKAASIVAIYDASGRKQPRMQHGVNIVRMSDGTVRKIMMK